MKLSADEGHFIALAKYTLRILNETEDEEWWHDVKTTLEELQTVQMKFCTPTGLAATIDADTKVVSVDHLPNVDVVEHSIHGEKLITCDPVSIIKLTKELQLWRHSQETGVREICYSAKGKAELQRTLKNWIYAIENNLVYERFLISKISNETSDGCLTLEQKRQLLEQLWKRCKIELAKAGKQATSEEDRILIDRAREFIKHLRAKILNLHSSLNENGVSTLRISGNYKSLWAVHWLAKDFFTRNIRDLLIAVHDQPEEFGTHVVDSYGILLYEISWEHISVVSRNSIKGNISPLSKIPKSEWGIFICGNDHREDLFTADAIPKLKKECDQILEKLISSNFNSNESDLTQLLQGPQLLPSVTEESESSALVQTRFVALANEIIDRLEETSRTDWWGDIKRLASQLQELHHSFCDREHWVCQITERYEEIDGPHPWKGFSCAKELNGERITGAGTVSYGDPIEGIGTAFDSLWVRTETSGMQFWVDEDTKLKVIDNLKKWIRAVERGLLSDGASVEYKAPISAEQDASMPAGSSVESTSQNADFGQDIQEGDEDAHQFQHDRKWCDVAFARDRYKITKQQLDRGWKPAGVYGVNLKRRKVNPEDGKPFWVYRRADLEALSTAIDKKRVGD